MATRNQDKDDESKIGNQDMEDLGNQGQGNQGKQGQGNQGTQNKQSNQQGSSERGFASMDPKRQREIASEGGQAAHQSGNAHEFTSEEAREAGKKSHGGQQGSNEGSGGQQGGSSGQGKRGG